MSQYFIIHPVHPQTRLIEEASRMINAGAVVAIPTDACYVLACHLDDKDAMLRLRRIRGIDEKHLLTLLCRDLSDIATYAKVDNQQYRLLKSATPGPYTFILEATKEVPRRLFHLSRKTIGLRIPDNQIVSALLAALNQPLLSTTLLLPHESFPLTEAEVIKEKLNRQLDLIIDGGACDLAPTTVVDMTQTPPHILREGKGDISLINGHI